MIDMQRKSILILFVLVLAMIPSALADRPHYVYDNANAIDPASELKMNEFGLAVDHATTAEIVVVTLQTLPHNETIDQAKLSYFNDIPLDGVKGIGKAGKDNGVLIMIVMDSHDWAFETGYGVEGNLTDADCGRIGRDVMTPYFVSGDFGGGLLAGMKTVASSIGYKEANVTTIDSTVDTTVDTGIVTNTNVAGIPWVWLIGIGVAIVVLVFAFSIYNHSKDGDEDGSEDEHFDEPSPPPAPEIPLKDRTPDGTEHCPKCGKDTPYVVTDTHSDTEVKSDGEYKTDYEERTCQECGTATTVILGTLLVATLLELEERKRRQQQD
jgi:uncharacterized membrane protein YgcG